MGRTWPRVEHANAAVSCEDCFFRRRSLCALGLDSPCPTFRPDTPDGLVPPRQPALLMRDGSSVAESLPDRLPQAAARGRDLMAKPASDSALESRRGNGAQALKITVLGKSPSWQDAGGACSGYLIETDRTKVLLDCGNGVFGKLREHADYTEIDGVIISHLHADHFLDLVPFSYALIYAPKQQPVPVHTWEGTDNPARPRMVAPPGAVETFRRVVGPGATTT